jgi:predicted RNase H-like nuclease
MADSVPADVPQVSHRFDAPMPSGAGPVRVLGVDGVKARWVIVALVGGRFERAFVVDRLADLAGEEAAAIGVDVPIGLVEAGWREADLDARRLLGNRRSSLFMTPPRAAVRAQTFEAALATCRERTGGVGLSIQAFGLFPKIVEAEAARAADPRLFEAHPELSFRELGGGVMRYPKRSWNGMDERRRALYAAGIVLDEQLDGAAGLVPPDDLLDAAAVAWTAHRLAAGRSIAVPGEPRVPAGTAGRIWV